jgi:uncharacterized membrane protein YhaH (DUF805 family)
MPEINPYASPSILDFSDPVPEQSGNHPLYRQGHLLVMHKQAVLPNICIKSNQPAQGRLKRNLYWHHPAIYIAVFVSPLIYVVLALVLRHRAVIEIGLSQEWFSRRRRAILIGWLTVLAGLAVLIAVLALDISRHPMPGWAILAGLVVAVVGAIYGLVAARMVAPTKITNNYVWLKGVHPAFLAPLSEWPE